MLGFLVACLVAVLVLVILGMAGLGWLPLVLVGVIFFLLICLVGLVAAFEGSWPQ